MEAGQKAAWERFCQTGNVLDYLDYRAALAAEPGADLDVKSGVDGLADRAGGSGSAGASAGGA